MKDLKSTMLRRATGAALTCWLLVVLIQTVRIGVFTPPSFDGAMNLEVASSIATGNGYRRMYGAQDAFPHEIQTNAPYILPAAAAYRALGVGIVQSELVNAAYLIALVLLATLLMRQAGGSSLSFLGGLSVIAIPGLLTFGFGGYGEVPALAWFFSAAWCWFRSADAPRLRRAVAAGSLLALACLTKTVLFIAVGGFSIGLLVEWLFHRKGQLRSMLKDLAAMAGGFLAPVMAYEIWKGISLGGKSAWLQWWQIELGHIGAQAGVTGTHSSGLLATTASHINILAGLLGLPVWVTVVWLCTTLCGLVFTLIVSTKDRRSLVAVTVLTTAIVYLGWWLSLTPDSKAWLRRILDGVICANLGAALAIATLNRRRGYIAIGMRAVLIAAPLIMMLVTTWRVLHTPFPDVTQIRQTVARVRQIPDDAYLFGIGWGSSPLIALLSGRHLLDFNDIPVSRIDLHQDAYLVKQPWQPGRSVIEGAFGMYGLSLSKKDDATLGVYKLPTFHPSRLVPGTSPVKAAIHLDEDYPYMRGFNRAEGKNGRWLSSDNVVLLMPQTDVFTVQGYAPPQSSYMYPQPLSITVSFNGCKAQPMDVPTNRRFTLHIPVPANCQAHLVGPSQVRIMVNNLLNLPITHDDRALTILAKELGFTDGR